MTINTVRCPSCKRDYPMLATAYVSRLTFEPICPECWARERYGDVAQHLHAQIERLEAEKAEMLAALEWYADHVGNCNKSILEGADARHALAMDHGQKARSAIRKARGEE